MNQSGFFRDEEWFASGMPIDRPGGQIERTVELQLKRVIRRNRERAVLEN